MRHDQIRYIASLLTEDPDAFVEPAELDPNQSEQNQNICVSCDEEIAPKDIGKYDGLCYLCANTSNFLGSTQRGGYTYADYADRKMAEPGPVVFAAAGEREGAKRGEAQSRAYHGLGSTYPNRSGLNT